LLSRKTFRRDNILFGQTFCSDKRTFVATKDVLFVATKMILVAAPDNDMYVECSNFSETFINNLDWMMVDDDDDDEDL